MDLRVHFDRPTKPIELEIENNSLCILSEIGLKLKSIRLPENGRGLNIKVNSKTYRIPIKNSVGFPAQYGACFNVSAYKVLELGAKKKMLLNWLIDTIQSALTYFFGDNLNQETRNDLEAFRNNCKFKAKFSGKWATIGEQRARVVIYQQFQQADIHIECKKYRSRTTTLSPILMQTSPNPFIFQKHLEKPIWKEESWHLE